MQVVDVHQLNLPCGVMVTQCPLEALFMVRVHAGQPLADCQQVALLTGSDLEGSRHSDSNRGPTVYKTVALPLSYAG